MKSDLVLPNGARFYNDHTHPEYSTPECRTLKDILAMIVPGSVLSSGRQHVATMRSAGPMCSSIRTTRTFTDTVTAVTIIISCHARFPSLLDCWALAVSCQPAGHCRGRQGWCGGARKRVCAGPVSAVPTSRLYGDGSECRHDAQSADSEYEGRTACGSGKISAAPSHYRRCQYV
jgi:Pup-ligase protein.